MSKTSLTSVRRSAAAWCAVAALLLSGFVGAARASEQRATKDFADIAAAVEKYVAQYGAEHVLLALDIDNTIMSMNTDLGSDHWFEWQRDLLTTNPKSRMLVGKTLDDVLVVQGTLYNLNHMHRTQSDLPAIIKKLQDQGIATMLLTSRGPDFRVATERELKRCDYDFSDSALAVKDRPNGLFLAYDPAKPERDGLTAEEIKEFKLGTPRSASYSNGVFMTAGQHKGMMLLTMLHHAGSNIKAIVYADDNLKHVGNVYKATVDRGLEITSFQYQHEDERVRRFKDGNKCDVYCRWKKLNCVLEEVCK
jgi:hypothetical protein